MILKKKDNYINIIVMVNGSAISALDGWAGGCVNRVPFMNGPY